MKKLNNFKKFIVGKISSLNKKRKITTKKTLAFIQRKPFTSFFTVLAILLLLMIVGNVLFSPKPVVESTQVAPKQVQIYKLGSAPQVSFQGKIEKSGVIKIVAQTGGIVSAINVNEGQAVDRGTNILSLSTNYNGGNAASLSRQIAQNQYGNAKDTYDIQKDIIAKQRDIADKNKTNSDQMRTITAQSAIDTQSVEDLDRTIVDSLASNITNLVNTNVGGANDTAILQAKMQLTQFQSALAQINSSYQALQVQSNSNSNDVSNDSYQIALKQLDIQEKALNMSLEMSRLQYNLALVMEANMYPVTPFAGIVERILVHVGDNVTSGTALANISGNIQHAEVVVSVPEGIAKNISVFEPSILYVGNKSISTMPSYVSRDATNGTLYSVIYDLEDSFSSQLTNTDYINVKIPIGVGDTTNAVPFVPLDSIVQTQDEAFVYVVSNGKATVRKITLGQIEGRFVEVLSGLSQNSEVIIDRNVIEGDKVTVVR